MVNIGVIGYGYWGPNIVRNFYSVNESQVVAISDKNQAKLRQVNKTYPSIDCSMSPEEIVKSSKIDAVAIVTPVTSHFELAKLALQNGKHIFVEKPFTATAAQAAELIELAEARKLKIMVDHTFLFTGAVRKMKEIIEERVLGDIYYYDSTRVNLGLFQHDVNVIWDLAPHDFSIMSYLLPEDPVAIVACGQSHISGMENVAYVTVYFSSHLIAHFNVNWLSPVKVRSTLIGGERKMLVWNDMAADEKLKVYDKGVDVLNSESIYNLLVSYRSSDIWAPKIDGTEALKLECEYFVNCLIKDQKPINDGHSGLKVVRLLEACDQSLRKKDKMVYL
jgi:predicted dehydrogenase